VQHDGAGGKVAQPFVLLFKFPYHGCVFWFGLAQGGWLSPACSPEMDVPLSTALSGSRLMVLCGDFLVGCGRGGLVAFGGLFGF
jgi:hypothetical protein